MSIYRYEEAIVEKMREITGDDRIIITPSDNIINVIPRIAKDEIKLPLIHMVRNTWTMSPNRNFGMRMNGNLNDCFPLFYEPYDYTCDGKIHRIHAVPILFSHTFEVWSRTRKENDELMRELIWFFSTMPEFIVDIPYGVNAKHVFNLRIDGEIIDNTSIVSHKDAGELFLQAFITTCDDAYLWKSSSHNPTCVHITAELPCYEDGHIVHQHKFYDKMTIEEKEGE